MLGKEVIMRELTKVDVQIDSPTDLFQIMGPRFEELGYVNEDYIQSMRTPIRRRFPRSPILSRFRTPRAA